MSGPTSPTDGAGGGVRGDGGDAWMAQRLLKPKRRQQIEIWLDEAVRWERSQNCAVGRSFGHSPSTTSANYSSTSLPADLPGPASTSASSASAPAPAASSSSLSLASPTSSSHQGEIPTKPGPRPPITPSCQVCGRHFASEDEEGIPTAIAAAAASGGLRGRFRGIMSAMGSLRVSGNRGSRVWDPALSTRMFMVEGTTNDSSHSSAASKFDSSDGGKRALDGRMARLRRAQKLLEKGRSKVGQT